MKLSDYIVDFLVQQGLRHLFLLPGGGCMHLADSVGKRPEIDYVCCLHEQACAFAAEAYGEFDQRFGCALVTSGPGGTNAVTGVACAWLESSPVLFISGQAKRADLISSRAKPVRSMGQQEVDIVSVVRPITKMAVTVLDPLTIRAHLEQAVWLATTGRKGPVWLDIPLDVQAVQIAPEALTGFVPPATVAADHSTAIAQLAESLRSARRPVVYAGNGIRAAGCLARFRELVSRLGLPVLVTWKAVDFLPEDCPEYIGRPGGIGQRPANFAQQKADLLLVLGARLDLPSVGFTHAGLSPSARKIVVDVDDAEMAKFNPPFDQSIHADLADFLPPLLEVLTTEADSLRAQYAPWLATCRRWVALFPVVQPEHWASPAGFVSTYALVDALSDAAQPDDILVPGSSGPCSDIFMQAFRVKQGQRILNAPGLGAMGTGLPGTIGACLAGGGRRVLNINGDGGFQLNIQELETVRRLGLPIKYFILDNNGYRSIVAMQRNHFQGRLVASDPSSRLTLPDLRRVGPAYGFPVFYVEEEARVREVIAETLSVEGPAICVVKTSANETTMPRVTSEIKPDGTIVSKPMEDMWPFLPRDEFAAIMAE
jgi:acetolactate synthase-1/2/3 large subunit